MKTSVLSSNAVLVRGITAIMVLAIASLMVFPSIAAAQSTDFTRMTRAEQISELQRQLAILIEMRNQLMNSAPAKSDGTVTASVVPLLAGGVVTGGQSIPVSYIQVRNTSDDTVTVTGFTLKQNGTASTDVIANLTISDNIGASRATSTPNPFRDGSGSVPTYATITPGAFKIFTIKANVAANVFASYGKNLKLDVTSVKTNGNVRTTYPLRGTTWSIGF